ncbi:MAG: C4-dicarboxylate ABC transporter permease [Alphaproteobacteria bacterium]|jgi:C4-dicarboxylate transporter DctM subunit|nr:C4-dicarboxylate ABC transporter permease [Alphaproteobacteria bacterium]PPR13822.1 MAG: C4-dicarboxylate TRAP transporter large permease protein DctM [Alphaproteobacteria bacterium MarineAlpha12_Bin1]|tara:strand:- start:38790 stop:40133 length:1344 start_codon:yes stop_codon:yes gene_type:complete
MFDANITIVVIGLLLVMVFAGIHVAVALGVTAMAGLFLVFKGDIPLLTFMVGSTGYEAIRAYVFAVVPLFMLMGEFISRSGAAADLYNAINKNLSRIPGRLAHATVLGNALFAFVTGTSLASATAFTSIAFPEMKKHGYHPGFALGSIAGSACLGMLIPPSLFMVVWGILTEQSIGILFIAGVIPGFLLTGLMIIYIFGVSVFSPSLVGGGSDRAPITDEIESEDQDQKSGSNFISFIGLFGVIFGVLGGIWVGWFTPTEGAAIGAILGLILGIVKGMRWPEIIDAVLAVAKTSVPIMVLLFAAQLYARVLALAGVGTAVQNFFIGTGLDPWQILAVMVIIWFVMGMLIDSVSIMLLTVPIFAPLAVTLGYDQVAFALIGILAIEAGILTPPFGLLVYAVKAVSPDKNVTLMQIFIGSTPYWIMLMIVMIAIANVPEIATWLPKIVM